MKILVREYRSRGIDKLEITYLPNKNKISFAYNRKISYFQNVLTYFKKFGVVDFKSFKEHDEFELKELKELKNG